MAFDQFSIGKDVVIDVILSDGTALQLPVTVTGFMMKAEYARVTSSPMSGKNLEVSLPKGWRGTIKLDRKDNTIDVFFAQREAAFYAGLSITTATITETITESDGTVTQFQYTECSLSFDDAGDKQGDKKIEQTIGVFATEREQIS